MRLIKPSTISGEIIDLINTARETLIIVSPYNRFHKWIRMRATLERAIEKGLKITFITREPENRDNEYDLSALVDMGIEPILVPKLHCKFYMNDFEGIVTSMNLLKSSDDFAIEIGYATTTREEYEELLSFLESYVLPYQLKQEFSLDVFAEVINNKINEIVRHPATRPHVFDDCIRFKHHGGYALKLENGKLSLMNWAKKGSLDYLDSNRHYLSNLSDWTFEFDATNAGNRGGYIKAIYKEIHATDSLVNMEDSQAQDYARNIISLITTMDKILEAADKALLEKIGS